MYLGIVMIEIIINPSESRRNQIIFLSFLFFSVILVFEKLIVIFIYFRGLICFAMQIIITIYCIIKK